MEALAVSFPLSPFIPFKEINILVVKQKRQNIHPLSPVTLTAGRKHIRYLRKRLLRTNTSICLNEEIRVFFIWNAGFLFYSEYYFCKISYKHIQ